MNGLDFHEALLDVRRRYVEGLLKNAARGVCYEVVVSLRQQKGTEVSEFLNFRLSDYADQRLRPLFEKWPLFSGDKWFPVPGDDMDPYSAYLLSRRTGTTWQGSYGLRRVDLLDFMIERTRHET